MGTAEAKANRPRPHARNRVCMSQTKKTVRPGMSFTTAAMVVVWVYVVRGGASPGRAEFGGDGTIGP